MRPEKHFGWLLPLLGAIVFLELFPVPLFPQSRTGDKVTIIALYPSVGTIKDLMTLRESKLIDIPNLEIVGVYHEKEKTDYRKSKELAASQGLDWITFYPISAPIQADAVFRANVCTPEFEKLFDRADGIIFFGGPDIPPYLYKEDTSLLTIIEDPYRHFLEVSFAYHLLGARQEKNSKPLLDRRPDLPVLGLCLGCQTLNVGAGGTLTQDIWADVYSAKTIEAAIALGPANWHWNPYNRLFPQEKFSEFTFHEIQRAEEGRFPEEIGWNRKERPYVFSSHHQQAKKLGRGFRVIASSLDGIVVEAIEHERYGHVLGLQFHPEAWVLYDPASHVQFTPEDKEPVNLKAYLEEHQPSRRFHQKIWSWVSRAWLDEHRKN